MTITIELAPEVLSRLRNKAASEGRDEGAVAADVLASALADEAERAFDQDLLSAGLVNEIKQPLLRDRDDRPLVTIQGKPLSQTIIEERR